MHLKICPCTLFMVTAKHAINGELSCDQRWAVMRSTASCQQCGWIHPVIPLSCRYVRVAMDSVVGRIDAIRLKNASKSIFLTKKTWSRLERKTPARQCATAENTESKNAPVCSYYIDTKQSFVSHYRAE
jgi:hypothetical protein